LDKVGWYYLCQNTNIPIKFFEKHLDKVRWFSLSINTNMSIEFFEKSLYEVNWESLSKNNFSEYFNNVEIEENKKILSKTHHKINTFYSIPSNSFSFLPKGGRGYLEVLEKYNF